MVIVLLGYMGSGKSSVGKRLSEQLEYPFIDLDTHIEKQLGLSIPELFGQKGELYFRRKEAEVLFEVLQQNNPSVVATGGGTPCYGTTMEGLLAQGQVLTVYLRTSVETLTARLFREKDSRPLLSHLITKQDLDDFIRKHLFERAFYYNQAAEVIETDGKGVQEISAEIIERLF